MGIRILVVDRNTTPLFVGSVRQEAVRLHDVGKPSEAVDAAVAKAGHRWADRRMPGAAILPDGRVIRWESGLLRVADADIARHPLIGTVAPDDKPPVLQRPDGTGQWSRTAAWEAGILDVDGGLVQWRRPRIVEVVSREMTVVVAPNASSAGPVTRSFVAFRVRMSDGSEEDLTTFWNLPLDYAAQAEEALVSLPLNEAFDWISAPLRQRVEADARVLCAGGRGLDLLCGDVRLRLQPAPDGEILLLEGIAGHSMAAGLAMATIGDRAATLGGDLVMVDGELRLEVLGLLGVVVLKAADGGLRLTCRTDGAEEVMNVAAPAVRTYMADLSAYLAACGDLSVEADAGSVTKLPTFTAWKVAYDRHPFRPLGTISKVSDAGQARTGAESKGKWSGPVA